MSRSCRGSAVVVVAAAVLGGCGRQERIIRITSEPPGAIVWLNDDEVGRTPVEAEFTFFGVYDVRLVKAGYEPLQASREAHAPLHEFPVIDLAATAIPGTRRTRLEWHFVLSPMAGRGAGGAEAQAAAEAELMERARSFRQEADRAAGAPNGGE